MFRLRLCIKAYLRLYEPVKFQEKENKWPIFFGFKGKTN